MANKVKKINLSLIFLLCLGTIGTGYGTYRYNKITQFNEKLSKNISVNEEDFPYHSKFAAAYSLGTATNYKHAVQTYTQLLSSKNTKLHLTATQQANIQYNIGTNLLLSGLSRDVNEDGSFKEESRFNLLQAKNAFEQSLRLNPDFVRTKFNLSVLNSVMTSNNKSSVKEQAGVELSNLPVGLP